MYAECNAAAKEASRSAGEIAERYAQVHEHFECADLDRDGTLTLEEFRKLRLGREEFERMDQNGDGMVTRRELMDRFFPFQRPDSCSGGSQSNRAGDHVDVGCISTAAIG